MEKRQPKEKINNTEALAKSGLRIVHVRPAPKEYYNTRRVGQLRGMTIAFRPTKGGAVQISTSLCKNGDTFSKKIGTKTAIENFSAGHTLYIPVKRIIGVVGSIQNAFGYND